MPSQDSAIEELISAFANLEIKHYESPRERANAIALSGEKELLTQEAIHKHAEKLRAALRYDTAVTDSPQPKRLLTAFFAGLSPPPKLVANERYGITPVSSSA